MALRMERVCPLPEPPLNRHLQLHLLVLLLASTAVLAKLISIPAAGLVVWRTFFAAVGALLWMAAVRRQAVWPGGRAAAGLIGIGLIVGLHWMCFFGAVRLAGISVCLAGMATIPLFTAFTEPFFERRRVRPFEVMLGLVVVVGITVIAGSLNRADLAGLAVALAGAMLAAVFPVLNRKLVHGGGDPLTMVAWEMIGACAAALAFVPWSGGMAALTELHDTDVLWLLVMAWLCTDFAHGFHIHLLKHFSAYTMNLAMSFEPLYGILAAALFFGEYQQLRPAFYAGLATILAVNLLHPMAARWARKRLRDPLPGGDI